MTKRSIFLIFLLVVVVLGSIVWKYYIEPSLFPEILSYPRVVGTDPKTGRTLIEVYHCSDLCYEENEDIYTILEGVDSRKECTDIGGNSYTGNWGEYIGCGPN